MNHLRRSVWVGVAVGVSLLGVGQPAHAVTGDPDDPLESQQTYLGASGTKTYGGAAGAEALLNAVPSVAGATGKYNNNTEKVIIAVIGDGVDLSHPDLNDKGVGLTHRDMSTGNPPTVSGRLATAMAGIAAAETDTVGGTMQGIAGVCRECLILNIRAAAVNLPPPAGTPAENQATAQSAKIVLAQAIAYAVQEIKAKHNSVAHPVGDNAQGVILLSYDHDLDILDDDPATIGVDESQTDDPGDTALKEVLKAILHQAVSTDANAPVDATNTSITVVAPAGDGIPLVFDATRFPTEAPSFPCSAKNITQTDPVTGAELESEKLVLCVGSVDTKAETLNQRSVFSNYGAWVDLSAPGQAVLATFPPDTTHATYYYDYLDSTHAAAAIAAGIAARVQAITYERAQAQLTPTLNTPDKVREMLWSAAYLNTPPGLLNDLLASQGAKELTRLWEADPRVSPQTVLTGLLDALLGVEDVWAAPTDPVADLQTPGDNFAVIPKQLGKGRNQFDLRARVRGSTYTVELFRHDCGSTAGGTTPPAIGDPGLTCTAHAYYAPGVRVATLLAGTIPANANPNRPMLLGKVCANYVVKGTTDCVAGPKYSDAGELDLGTNYWEEGEYTLRLTVMRAGAPSAVSTKRLFVDRSFDSHFNESDSWSLVGTGAPLVIGDVVVHGPNLADIARVGASPSQWVPTTTTTRDGHPEIIVGSVDLATGKRLYVFNYEGRLLLKSVKLDGPIVGTPAVGDIIPGDDGKLEIVATANTSTGNSLYVFQLPAVFDGGTEVAPIFQKVIGASKTNPAVGRGQPSDPYQSVFVTTTNNLVQWWKWEGSTDAITAAWVPAVTCANGSPGPFCRQGTPADLTCIETIPFDSNNRNDYRAMHHFANALDATYDKCDANLLMESSPLVASLQATSPIRVFVPSQDPFSTYGYDPQPGSVSPRLKLLPGFPMQWTSPTQPAPGGTFDSTLAYNDNRGALQLFNVQYEFDSRVTCPLGSPCNAATQCKGKLAPGDSAALLCNDQAKVVILEVQGATTAVTTPTKDKKRLTTIDAEYAVPGELFMYSGAATGDIVAGDYGALETVLVGASGKVYLFNADADLVIPPVGTSCLGDPTRTPGWPQQMAGRGAGTPLIADLDGDGNMEIITTSSDQLLYAWDKNGCLKRTLRNPDGTQHYGFPRALKSSACYTPKPAASPLRTWAPNDIVRCTTPAIANIDTDPQLEMVMVAAAGAPTTNAVYIWDMQEPVAALGSTARLFPTGLDLMPTAWAAVAATPGKVLFGTQHGNDAGLNGEISHATITGTIKHNTTVVTNATVTISWTTPNGDSQTVTLAPIGPPDDPDTLDVDESTICLPNCHPWNDGGVYTYYGIDAGTTVTVTASAPGYPPTSKVVTVSDNVTYTQNFNLNNLPVITIKNMSGTVVPPNFTMTETSAASFPALQFQVVATDPDGDTVQFSVAGLPPIALLNGSPFSVTNSGPSPMTVTFSWDFGTLSNLFRSLGNCTTYSFTPTFNVWDAGTGLTGPGSYQSQAVTIQLLKCGAGGNTSCPVAQNHLPIARGYASPQYAGSNAAFTLNGNGSCDPDGPVSAYTWSFASSSNPAVTAVPLTNASSAVASGITPVVGYTLTTLSFQLAVTGNGGPTDVATTPTSFLVWGNEPCFIATAAYGTPQAPEIDLLRAYRDRVLRSSWLGQRFVELYYRTSPPVARFIADKPALRAIVRSLLKPIVAYCQRHVDVPRDGP